MNYELEPELLCLIQNLLMNQYLFLLTNHNLFIPDELAKARSPTRADRPSLPPEAKAVSAQFADFLKTRVKSVGITDLSRNIQSFIDKVGMALVFKKLSMIFKGAQKSGHLANRTSLRYGPKLLSGSLPMPRGIWGLFAYQICQALNRRLETHDNFVGLTEDERTHICDLSERWGGS